VGESSLTSVDLPYSGTPEKDYLFLGSGLKLHRYVYKVKKTV
jgi:hypothetical protein